MKPNILTLLLLFSVAVFGEELPKSCLGTYAGEMPAYTAFNNDIELKVEKHDVKLVISEKFVRYYAGNVELKGTYEVFKQEKNTYLINATLSNGKNFQMDIELIVDKKGKTLKINGKNGEPDAHLEKII